MFEQVSLDLGGRKLSFETGKMARQAHGAVVARYGDTVSYTHLDVYKRQLLHRSVLGDNCAQDNRPGYVR